VSVYGAEAVVVAGALVTLEILQLAVLVEEVALELA
jgi:hypothetical protein